VNCILSFLESEDVSLGVNLLVKLDDGTAGAAEHGAAVLHHRALNLAFFARLPSELDKREDWNDQA